MSLSGGKRIAAVGLIFAVLFLWVICVYFRITAEPDAVDAGLEYQTVSYSVTLGDGYIYDRNLVPLVNEKSRFIAAAVPELIETNMIEYAVNADEFEQGIESGEMFTFECAEDTPESEGLTVFEVPERYSADQTAQHVIGYISQGKGVDGIESAYDSVLRSDVLQSVTYPADGFGNILKGIPKTVIRNNKNKSGVVTTIDKDIQKICERAGAAIDRGAIVVTEISTGEISAMASFPAYSTERLSEAINDERSPMINRCLYSYSVGSVFKLVTSAEAMNEDVETFVHECGGSIDINGKLFRCHRLEGHGMQNMTDAIVNSCNTYFIDLSRFLDIHDLRNTAYTLGFGREIHLCSGMTASAGVLPSEKELDIPAELANFSFGQGKLSATPLHISQLTCAIAGGGKMPMLRLIKGLTEDGESIGNEKSPQYAYVLDKETADSLKNMMIAAIYDNDNTNACPNYTTAGAKTSTAQTGRFDPDGTELCNAWITGFFPSDAPKYAVTVLVENGGYGNDSAAPVFREIIDRIAMLENKISERD